LTSNILKVGIAGYGVVGQRRHQVIEEHPDLHTVAVCDQLFGQAGADRPAGDIPHLSDFRSLLEQELDVLFVCLPNDLAPLVTIEGLKRGLHVFCEKPPGRTVEDIERVIECEKQFPHLKLKYGFNHRYHDSVRDALAMVQSNELGRIINLKGVYGKSKFISFGHHSDWRIQRSVAGGGILLDQGIHMVDLMRLFAGEFNEVSSFVSNAYWRHDVEDNAYALIRSEDGAVAMLHSSATQWRHRFHLDITLERGAIILSGILTGSKSYGAEELIIARSGDDDTGDPDEETRLYEEDASWAREIADFAGAIINGDEVTEGSSEDALKTMQLVYRIYCADEEWRDRWGLSVGADREG
jgi:predicted dehydrogenase